MTVPSEGDTRHICMICGRVLDFHQKDRSKPEGEWKHGIASTDPEDIDHPVIAVLATDAPEQLRSRCDFCFGDDADWLLPARTFQMPNMPNMSVGDWAACAACAQLLEADAWNKLFVRAKASYEARQGPMSPPVETGLKAMYRKLRKNVSGSIRKEEGPK